MAERVRYMPMDLISRITFLTKDINDRDLPGNLTALVEDAYQQGYHDGYVRGMVETDARLRAEWEREHEAKKAAVPDGD